MAPPGRFPPEESFGRFRRLELRQELAEHGRNRAVSRDQAFRLFSECSGYPVAHDLSQSQTDGLTLAKQLNANVIEQVLQHDLLTGPRGPGRDRALSERILELGCRYAGQTTSLRELT